MRQSIFRPAFVIFCLAALVAFALLIALGNWQMRRLAWKEQLVADVNSRIAASPVEAPGPQSWPGLTRDAFVYTPVTLTGHYDHDREVHVWFALSSPQGGPLWGAGYFIMTPFVSDEGWTVIVNRGFVPEANKEQGTRPQTLVKGEVTITGLMRFDEPSNWLSPEADTEKNVWIVRRVGEMASFLRLDRQKTAPYWIDLTKGQGVDGLPQGGETRITFRNTHLQYALTWYGLAASLVLVFGVWLFRVLRQKEE